MTVFLRFQALYSDAIIPECHDKGSNGLDLHLHHIDDAKTPLYTIEKGDMVTVSTGVAVQIPEGFEGQIRSIFNGENLRLHVPVTTISSELCGEIKVCVRNLGDRVILSRGERIARLVIVPVARCVVQVVDDLSKDSYNMRNPW